MASRAPSRPSGPRLAAAVLAVAAVVGGGRGAEIAREAAAGTPDEKSPSMMVKRWRAEVERDDQAAFDRVVAEYEKPGLDAPLRGLLVSTVCDAARGEAARARVAAWREKDAAPKDAWLWYRSLLDDVARDASFARTVVTSDRCPVVRGAAVRALAACADPDALKMLPAALTAITETGARKTILVEAWAEVLARQPGRFGAQEFTNAVHALLPQLSDDGVEARTRLAVARALRRAFETDSVSLDPKWWHSLLQRVDAPINPDEGGSTRPSVSRFFDVEATGDRVVYVLDASDSMLDELPKASLAALKALSPNRAPAPGSPVASGTPSIPWKGVRTSMDAVVEFTKLSIKTLRPDVSFCVVLFGSDVQTLAATKTLVAASPTNVDAAVHDLDRFQRKGRGLGMTNLHGALRHAFSAAVGAKDTDPDHAPDALALLTAGTTALFVLSDGVPTRDDWDDAVRVGENPKPVFASVDPLADDVERMNLFQASEIHTIALGYSDDSLLPALARVGGGRSRTIGAPSAAEATAPYRLHLPPGPAGHALFEFLRGLDAPPKDPKAPRDGVAEIKRRLAATTAIDEKVALAHALAERGDRAAIPVLLDGLTSSSADLARDADHGLSLLAKRSFGGSRSLRPHERWALRHNWEWWWAKQPPPPEPKKDEMPPK